MCGVPMVMAAVAVASTVLGTVSSMNAQKAQGQAANQAAQYQAQIAENNAVIAQNNRTIALKNIDTAKRNKEAQYEAAKLAEKAADEALQAGKIKESQLKGETAKLIGRQRAVMAANGLDVNEGSAVDIQAETAGIGKLDQLTVRSNAERESLGYKLQAYNYKVAGENFLADAVNFAISADNAGREGQSFQYQAQASRAAGASALSVSKAQSTSTLLGGIGSVATKWYTFGSSMGGPKESSSSGVNPYIVGDTSPYNFKTGYM